MFYSHNTYKYVQIKGKAKKQLELYNGPSYSTLSNTSSLYDYMLSSWVQNKFKELRIDLNGSQFSKYKKEENT